MSEENKNQDPIEGFFEKNVWDYDIPFRESDWLSLEERLDIRDKQLASRYRRRWLAVAAVIFFSLIGFFTYENYTQINQINRQLADQESTRMPLGNEGQLPVSPETEKSQQDKSSGETNYTPKISNSEQETGDSGRMTSPTSGQDESDKQTGISNHGNDQPGSLPAGRSETLFISEFDCSNCDRITGDTSNLEPLSLKTRQIFKAVHADGENPSLAPQQGPVPLKRDNISSFSLGILAGPDLSSAGSISRLQSPGFTLGLQAEYHITSRLSLRTGIQHSTVRYNAGAGEYNPPSGYWPGDVAATRTAAECSLIDIPMNLKYEVFQLKNSRFFASTGINSYIMLNEKYRFDYTYNDDNLPQEWNEKTGTGYWLSNATISFGYELDMHSKWSLTAEPFLKMPIRGVGWGDVDLFSTGTVIGLNYKFGS